MAMLLSWLGGKLAAPVAGLCALLLAAGLAWQTARIEGVPLFGGGFKAQVAGLQQQIAVRDLAQARAESAALLTSEKLAAAMDDAARAQASGDQQIQTQIQTVIREVPHAVPISRDCLLPWGAVRLLDAAASGTAVGDAAAAIAPGQPDGAASDVKLSEALTVLVGNAGIARQNANQLEHLEQAVTPLKKKPAAFATGFP